MAPVAIDQDFIQDPYALYDRMRQQAPAIQVTMPGGVTVWLVTRYEESRTLLADPTTTKVPKNLPKRFNIDMDQPEYFPALTAHMLNSDPPDHTRLRTLVNKAFTSRTVERLRPRIERIIDDLLDEMAGHDQVDLLDSYAFPLPNTVICELLGVPQGDRDTFRSWSNTLVSVEASEKVVMASEAMTTYLTDLIASKRANPAEDLLTALIQAVDEGDRLDERELVSTSFLLMSAGHETTVNLIGNSMLALLRNPEQLAKLRNDPSLLPCAVEEFLRYESPIDMTTLRLTTEPVRLGDVVIPADEAVFVSLCAVNRDISRFTRAGELDITRKGAGHLAFGHGIHYCLGAPLARLEGQLAIGKLISRFPHLALAVDPAKLRWRFSTLFRGLETFPVALAG
jgi:cytochrome P450